MRAVEFTKAPEEAFGHHSQEVAAKFATSGRARVIVLTPDDPEDAQWRAGAYEQFVREEAPDDAVYDSY